MWPTFVEELWEAAPGCAMSAGPLDIFLSKPEIDITASCNEMIRNGGQNTTLTTSEPWLHTDPGVQVGSGKGMDGGDAIITMNRGGSWTGLAQNIDSRCVEKMRGRMVEFSAWIKLLNKDGTPATNIDPDSIWWRRQHPQLTLNLRHYRDDSTKEYIYDSYIGDAAQLTRPYNSAGWNLVHGVFSLPSTQHLFVEIENAPDNIDFYLDNVSLVPYYCNRDQLVRNGGLEELSVTKYWDTWGEPKLTIVPGYGGTGNAVRASVRPHYSHGPAQVISLDCNAEGKFCTHCSIALLCCHAF